MKLTPWKSTSLAPFSSRNIDNEMSLFQREMNNLVNSFFNRGELAIPSIMSTDFYPSVDIKEKDNKYLLDADVPGLNESDIDIDLHDNILTIKGEKKAQKEFKEGDFVCKERSLGSFRRDLYLDKEVDESNVKADLKNGVLHIELSQKPEAKTAHKKIPIMH